jgi:hypothetical protein
MPSTNAILFYGYCWKIETDRPWTIGNEDDDEHPDEDGWEERYAIRCGLMPPLHPYPTRESTSYTVKEQAAIDEHSSYWAAKRALTEAARCEVGTHCSSECPMPFIAVKASIRESRRGFVTAIDGLAVDSAWNAQLEEFCALMEIPTQAAPRWYLVSYWGMA